MGAILKVEFKRAFKNWRFLLMVLVGCLMAWMAFFNTRDCILASRWRDYINGHGDGYFADQYNPMDVALEIWMPSNGSANKYFYMLIMFMPVLSAIPYGVSFLTDIKTGVVNQLAIRCKKRHYYAAKLITAFVSGGTVAVIPFIVNLIICMCYLPWGAPFYSTALYSVSPRSVLAELYYTYPALYVLIYMLHLFVMYGLLNCICLTFVYVEDNRFAVMLTPFILYYTSYIICRYIIGNGSKSLFGVANMIFFFKHAVVAIAIQMAVLVIVAAAFLIRIKKDVIY